MIDRALGEIQFNQADIDRKLLNYKYSLIIHEFEKYHISANLNDQVSEQEIENYYLERPENFLLKQNIVKCLFAKIPRNTPGIRSFRRNIRSYPNANLDDIKDYCYQYANGAFTDEDVWLNFEEISVTTPLKEVKNPRQFLETSTFSETSDQDFIYFFRILDYKIINELAPLAFIQDNIENIIINKRKILLKKDLEESIYEEAKVNQSFEIFAR